MSLSLNVSIFFIWLSCYRDCLIIMFPIISLQAVLCFFFPNRKDSKQELWLRLHWGIHSFSFLFFLRFSWLMEIAGAGTSCMFKIDHNNYLPLLLSFTPWITLPIFCRETEAAGGLHGHPKSRLWMQPWSSSTFWQLLLWRWIKPLNFCDKDQVGLLWILASCWFFCVWDM